jgi:hypothetical protein
MGVGTLVVARVGSQLVSALVVARVGGQLPLYPLSFSKNLLVSAFVVARAGGQQPSFADIALYAYSNRLADTLGLGYPDHPYWHALSAAW